MQDAIIEFVKFFQDGHGAGFPLWLQILLGLALLMFKILGGPWLLRQAEAAKNRAAQIKIDATTSLISQRGAIMEQVKNYLEWRVEAFAATAFPQLCIDIREGKYSTVDSEGHAHVSKDKIDAELKRWVATIRADTITYFTTNGGLDIVSLYGEKGLDDLIDALTNKFSPFPGVQTASELVKKEVIPLLISNGIAWVRKYYLGQLPVSELVHAGIANPDGTATANKPV